LGGIPKRPYASAEMPQRRRPNRVEVKLDDAEHAALAAKAAAAGMTRSQVVRDALRTALADDTSAQTGEMSRREALELLARAARDGSVGAAEAVARELRLRPVEADRPPATTGTVRLRDLPPAALHLVE
jgi:Ribbon-helix-helix protein, copG family